MLGLFVLNALISGFVHAGERKDKAKKVDNLEGCNILQHCSSECNRWLK